MNNETLIIISLILMAIGIVFFIYLVNISHLEEQPKQYQGPVRPTDDKKYFRETGITRQLNEVENANS